jgi:stringent starvation protein B
MTTSRRPYLIRALYDWCIDNKLTPHIVVDTKHGGCEVPEEYVNEDGKIILNIGEKATWDLYIDDFNVGFGARFKGEPHKIKVSTNAVVGIYDKESGAGMVFGEALPPEEPEPEPEQKVPHLRLVVNNDES